MISNGTEQKETLASAGIQTRQDFMRLVQSPTHRIKDNDLLVECAYLGMNYFEGDFEVKSAAVCVLGYRLIEGLVLKSEIEEALDKQIIELVTGNWPNVQRGLFLRWHTSVRLVAGYIAYRRGQKEIAAEQFARVADFAFDLNHWPSMLTNVLYGIFLSGWVRYEVGDFDGAASIWQRAEGVFRYGAGISSLPNFYAYGEVANAVRVAQECFVGYLQARNGGEYSNVEHVPAGRKVDVYNLSGLVHNLGLPRR